MFLNQEQFREWQGEVKISNNRREYFRSYNQQPHRQEYLKEYSQIRRLVAKYNRTYQDQRKQDRHKLTDQDRYRIKILTQELKKKGWVEINNIKSKENLSSSPFFFFNVVLVGKNFPLTSYLSKSFFFYPHMREGVGQQKQEAYQFAYLIQKEGKSLGELLAKKPRLFSRRLKEIEKISQAVSQHWKKSDIIQTINQIPQAKEWQLPNHWERQDLSALLLKNGEAGGKNKLVLDFDHYKRDSEGNFLLNEEQRKEIDVVIDYLINYWKLPWYEVSKSGARKLHLNIDELPAKSKLWWKLLVIGDILGEGSQTTLPVSKNRRIEFSKWSEKGTITELPQIKLENWEQDLAKFSLSSYDKGVRMRRDFAKVKRKENNFFPTNTTKEKGLNYYGTKIIKPLKIFAPQYVEKLSSTGGSRDSHYYQVPYLDPVSQQVGRFLVDVGWRGKEFGRIVNWDCSPSSLVVRIGEKTEFLVGVG